MTTAHLLSGQSADLVSAFDRERQRQALRRLAALLELDPARQVELFRVVEEEISNQLVAVARELDLPNPRRPTPCAARTVDGVVIRTRDYEQ